MFANYLKVAFRNFRRHRRYTAINMFGLAVALAVATLVLLFIRQQWMLDRAHTTPEHVHRITTTVDGRSYATSPKPLGPVLTSEYSGVEAVAQLQREQAMLIRTSEGIEVRGFSTTPAFFEVFDGLTLSRGRPETALQQPRSVVLTHERARALFGDDDPLGGTLRTKTGNTYTVTGVLAETQPPSHLHFDALFSETGSVSWGQQGRDAWAGVPSTWTYVRLKPTATAQDLQRFVARVLPQHLSKDAADRHALAVQSLADIRFGAHLYRSVTPGANLTVTSFLILAALGLLVLIVAGFNYVNLSVARSLQRAQEIGVRRAMGAQRMQIAGQLVGESLLLALLATVLAGFLLWGLVPLFNSLHIVSFQDVAPIAFNPLRDPGVALLLVGVGSIVGLLAGVYPALVLSGFEPVEALGRLQGGSMDVFGGLSLRKVLLSAQFGLTLVLAVTAVTMYRQAAFLKGSDYGFRADRIVAVELHDVTYETFRQQALQTGGVAGVAATDQVPLRGGAASVYLQTGEPAIRAVEYSADVHFPSVMDVSMRAARDEWANRFRTGRAVLINAEAARALRYERPDEAIGRTITVRQTPSQPRQSYTVVGVVENYHFQNKRVSIRPMLIRYEPSRLQYALVRVEDARGLSDVRTALNATWDEMDTVYPFESQPLRSIIDQKAGPITDAALMTSMIALLAVLVACLGLMGLATYVVETRRRETAIHKAFGASAWEVTWLVSKNFAALITAAIVVALPIAWVLNAQLLQFFANRIGIGGLTLGGVGGGLVLLALLTIGSQAIRAAQLDPAAVLRDDRRGMP